MTKRRADLIGLRFGKLSVVAFAGLDARRNARWLCVCDCGEQRTHVSSSLKRGNIVSCGCGKRGPQVAVLAESHPVFCVFCGMLGRCFNPKSREFARYGDRGITVCERWRAGGFWVFLADMGERPTPSHSIDRIDNSRGYEPDNCRWATKKEQSRNTRANKLLTYKGETLTMAEWSERLGVNYMTFKARIRTGWTLEEAFDPRLVDKSLSETQIQSARLARASGMTYRKVAELIGTSIATAYKACGLAPDAAAGPGRCPRGNSRP